MMNYYDYHKFVHPVPDGYTIPKGTQVQLVNKSAKNIEVSFFTAKNDFETPAWEGMQYFLTYDITKQPLPTKINSVIYNVKAKGLQFPVAVYQGPQLWSAFNHLGDRLSVFSPEIESFDTTPPEEEEEQ